MLFVATEEQEQTPVCSCSATFVGSSNNRCHFSPLRRAWPLFEILITRHTYQMPSISIVSLALCSYLHVHLCLSSFLESRQKHLFTPLLSREVWEGEASRHNDSHQSAASLSCVFVRLCGARCNADGPQFGSARTDTELQSVTCGFSHL